MPVDYSILRARQPLGTASPFDKAVDVKLEVGSGEVMAP